MSSHNNEPAPITPASETKLPLENNPPAAILASVDEHLSEPITSTLEMQEKSIDGNGKHKFPSASAPDRETSGSSASAEPNSSDISAGPMMEPLKNDTVNNDFVLETKSEACIELDESEKNTVSDTEIASNQNTVDSPNLENKCDSLLANNGQNTDDSPLALQKATNAGQEDDENDLENYIDTTEDEEKALLNKSLNEDELLNTSDDVFDNDANASSELKIVETVSGPEVSMVTSTDSAISITKVSDMEVDTFCSTASLDLGSVSAVKNNETYGSDAINIHGEEKMDISETGPCSVSHGTEDVKSADVSVVVNKSDEGPIEDVKEIAELSVNDDRKISEVSVDDNKKGAEGLVQDNVNCAEGSVDDVKKSAAVSVDDKKSVTSTKDHPEAGPSGADRDSSDEDGGPVPQDSLGLLAEARTLLRYDDDDDAEEEADDDDDDDLNNEDEESNQMAPDSSEVESNAPANELPDSSDGDQVDPTVLTAEQALPCTTSVVMDFEEETTVDFEFTIASISTDAVPSSEVKAKDLSDDALTENVVMPKILIEEPTADSSLKDSIEAEGAPTESAIVAVPATSEEIISANTTAPSEDEKDKAPEEKDDDATKTVPASEQPQEKEPESAATPTKAVLEAVDEKHADATSKTKKLEIAKPGNVMNIVDLESSSDSDDVRETVKTPPRAPAEGASPVAPPTTSVNIPGEVDVMSAGRGGTTSIASTRDESVISGIPAAAPPKKTAPRINTSEISIKTTAKTPEPPTITIPDETDVKVKKQLSNFSLEVFNVDSDEEEGGDKKRTPKKLSAIELQKARDTKKCIDYLCTSGSDVDYYPATSFVLSYFEVKRSRRRAPLVCAPCLRRVTQRSMGLMEGVRGSQPLLSLNMDKECQEFVEISDSESDSDGEETPAGVEEKLPPHTVKLLQEELATVLNDTWRRYGLGDRLRTCETELHEQLGNLEKDSAEIDDMLSESQKTLDQLRNELYNTFASEVRELEPIHIDDGGSHPLLPISFNDTSDTSDSESRRSKRQRRVVNYEETSVRSPIPLGYTQLHAPAPAAPAAVGAVGRDCDSPVIVDVKLPAKPGDENADVSVVELSAEAAPAGLPAPGALARPPLRVGDAVYAVRQSSVGTWAPARVLEVWPAGSVLPGSAPSQFQVAKIRFDQKQKGSANRQLTGRQLAYSEPSAVRLRIATRVIARFKAQSNAVKRESYYSGIIAEPPTPVNAYRYLVFFDDGYAQYVPHGSLRVVCEESPRVWDDVHPNSREFVRNYLQSYPERPMVRLQSGQALKTEYNGKWWVSRVVEVDASLVNVLFEEDGRVEWIYRGSTRLAPLYLELQASQRHRPRGLTRLNKQAPIKANMPYVEYTRSDEQEAGKLDAVKQEAATAPTPEEGRRGTVAQLAQQRAVAKKSTAAQAHALPTPRSAVPQPVDNLMTRVVYYSPKAAVKPYKMVAHTCSPQCRRTDVLPLKELKTYNPLTRPLLTGWERQILRCKGKKVVMYRAPCGRRLRGPAELHRYLRAVRIDMGVDLFDFNHATHCLAEFVLNKCYVSKKDLSHGKENVPVPCVNYYDGSLPDFCLYNTERTPTTGVPLNLDPDFLCGCDCTDDCQDKSKCACWKLTLEGARTIGLDGPDVGYSYKRLPEPLPSGIYECNSRCKCAQTCLNRVAQHPLQLKLQVFKTLNRGWGIRALNDVPKGAFLCVYAGNLLTDATANSDGIREGDEYLAELDYIEVVERLKEDYESDAREDDDKKSSDGDGSEEEEEEKETEKKRGQGEADADFQPDYVGPNVMFTKSLRKRKKDTEKTQRAAAAEAASGEAAAAAAATDDDQFITISDDEEVREPSRFTAQAGLDGDEYRPRHRSVRSLYGRDEACYIMDAKVQGNIGRYLNHSCTPNVFVQNVFVDTHDPRFPWVAFFSLNHIQAGSELTWNYNYDVGSVPDKVLYCKCGAANCRGRLL